MKTIQESIEEYKKGQAPLLRHPMFWELYAEHMAYCDKYEKLNKETQEVMSLEDYITIKKGEGPKVQTKDLEKTWEESEG
jgi:hypothetical protein